MFPTISARSLVWNSKITYGALMPQRIVETPVLNLLCLIPAVAKADKKTNWGYHRVFQLDVELLIEKHELKFDYTIQSLQIKISHYFDSITYELLFLICNEAEQVLFAGYLKNYT